MASANEDSYQAEEACPQMASLEDEITASNRQNAMELSARIDRFCQSVADKSASSLSGKLNCVQKKSPPGTGPDWLSGYM